MEKTVIKCKDCGFKYYKGDVHLCGGVGGIKVEEKAKDKKETTKTRKDSFKLWKDDEKNN